MEIKLKLVHGPFGPHAGKWMFNWENEWHHLDGQAKEKYTMNKTTPYTLQTWYFEYPRRWHEESYYQTLDQLEKDLMLYKLHMNLGYKVFLNDALLDQWFDKESYIEMREMIEPSPTIYKGTGKNDTTTDKKN